METTKLTLEKDYELIRANFEAQPKTIIMQYADKFWIQLIKPLVKDEYDSLDQTFYYENINDPYIQNPGFNSMSEALVALKLFRAMPVIHKVSDTPNENGDYFII